MKKRFPDVKQGLLFAGIIVIAFISFFAVNRFITEVTQSETIMVDRNLKIISANGAQIIQRTFHGYLSILKTAARSIENQSDMRSEQTAQLLQEICKENRFDGLIIDFPDGNISVSAGQAKQRIDPLTFARSLQGEEVILDVTSDEIGLPVVMVMVPLHDERKKPVALLRLILRTQTLTEDINLTLFDSKGYYHLVDQNGRYVAIGGMGNDQLMDMSFFEAIEVVEYEPGYSAEQVHEVFRSGTPLHTRYTVNGLRRHAYLEPVGINNWVLMTIVPKETITAQAQHNISYAVSMAAQLLLILAVFFLYLFYLQRRSHLAAALNDQCFRALVQQTGDVVLEWDFAKNRITSMANFKSLFGREMVTSTCAAEAVMAGLIHPDDIKAFSQVFETVKSGKSVEHVRFRIRNEENEFRWCTLSGVVVRDQKGKPYKAIGFLGDIHERVKREESLTQKSQKDQLTGLYNKVTTELFIKQALEDAIGTSTGYVLLMIDIDNFKRVNDSLGHLYGDGVLTRLSGVLRSVFRSSDVIGRVGGDEFFVFMKGHTQDDLIREKSMQICRLFQESSDEDAKRCNLSVSIGAAVFPRDGLDFESLYRCADLALYQTKEKGKDGFAIYDPSFGSSMQDAEIGQTAGDQV